MSKVRIIITTLLISFLVWGIASAACEWYIDQLKATKGMITAESIIQLRYILPIGLAALVAYVSYKIFKD